ncbi:MAG: PRC-barrel domain-containing protein, partial [Geminicoccaceae bacterium]|nr:PRC-barrel domain-containing protein [Geminicoccaceae bacterium]
GPPAEDAEETLAAGDEQTMSDDQSDQQGMSEDQSMAAAGDQDGEPTIGGGLDIPRDEIDTKYGPLAWATFDEVIGADVVSAKGEPVGEIVALVRERPMGDFFAVLSDGGDQVIVPIKAFEIAEDDRIAMVGGEEDLEGMPEYDPERYEEVRE